MFVVSLFVILCLILCALLFVLSIWFILFFLFFFFLWFTFTSIVFVYHVYFLTVLFLVFFFFFFKQKTAYEMRISDWSLDVCSSDLDRPAGQRQHREPDRGRGRIAAGRGDLQVPAQARGRGAVGARGAIGSERPHQLQVQLAVAVVHAIAHRGVAVEHVRAQVPVAGRARTLHRQLGQARRAPVSARLALSPHAGRGGEHPAPVEPAQPQQRQHLARS